MTSVKKPITAACVMSTLMVASFISTKMAGESSRYTRNFYIPTTKNLLRSRLEIVRVAQTYNLDSSLIKVYKWSGLNLRTKWTGLPFKIILKTYYK